MSVFRIVVKSGKTSMKFLSYMDCKISGHFWSIARALPMALARASEGPRSLSFTENPLLGTVTGFSPSTSVVRCQKYSTSALYPFTHIAFRLQSEAVASLSNACRNVQCDRPTNICRCHTRSVPAASRTGPPTPQVCLQYSDC